MNDARLRTALERALNDLLAYGRHNDGEWINKGGHPETHRHAGQPCNCGLDTALANASAALGYKPQTERERLAVNTARTGPETDPSEPTTDPDRA